MAEREAGELGRLVAEHLGGGLAPVVALQQGGQVVGRAAGRERALRARARSGPPRRRGRAADASRRGRPPGRPARSGSRPRSRRPARAPGSPGRHRWCWPCPADATATRGARHGDAASVTDPWLGRGVASAVEQLVGRPSRRWPGSARRGSRCRSRRRSSRSVSAAVRPSSAALTTSRNRPSVSTTNGSDSSRRIGPDDRVHDAEEQPDPQVGAGLAERPVRVRAGRSARAGRRTTVRT